MLFDDVCRIINGIHHYGNPPQLAAHAASAERRFTWKSRIYRLTGGEETPIHQFDQSVKKNAHTHDETASRGL